MKVGIHAIQNFAPSCLNRDDVNAPKDCEFGGYRRARISSQCLKRAIRRYWNEKGILQENRASRTRLLVKCLARELELKGRDPLASKGVAEFVLTEGLNLGLNQDGTTEYLLFLGNKAIADLTRVIEENWDLLHEGWSQGTQKEGSAKKKKGPGMALPGDLQKQMEVIFDGTRAADLALFGRMIADKPDKNIDASCQVAHAISTHRISMDLDYYTAVDDLQPREEAGAGMIGTVEFNSACFYRYALLDFRGLAENLGGDRDLAMGTVEGFIRAFVEAIPTGKQNSMAAHNPPSFVLAVVTDGQIPWSLANAFANPVFPEKGGLVAQSILRLDDHWGKVTRAYGHDGISACTTLCLEEVELKNLRDTSVETLDDLTKRTLSALGG